jgi:hypothetical protein
MRAEQGATVSTGRFGCQAGRAAFKKDTLEIMNEKPNPFDNNSNDQQYLYWQFVPQPLPIGN